MVGYIIGKGVAMGATVVAVLHSGLPPFAQALVIALVSASIGAVGVIGAAIISARASDRAYHQGQANERHLRDIKGAIGADQRLGESGNDG